MPTKKRHNILIATILALTLATAGCTTTGSSDSDVVDAGTDVAAAEASGEPAAETGSGDAAEVTDSGSVELDAAAIENQDSHYDADDLDYDTSRVVSILLNGSTATVEGDGATVDGSSVTITAAGVYELTGSLTDGEVIVDAGDTDDVILILSGVDIANSDGAAIAITNADDAAVLLADGSTNWLTDGGTYVFPDAETDEPNAALYSSSDLTIAGDGELIIDANYNDGITSKDGLVIESGTIIVVAADDGIRGKDYVIIDGGTITVDAGGDGIKADNDEDVERGYILINDGVVDVTSGDDGIQAATDALISGGIVSVVSGTNPAEVSGRGIQGDVMVVISGGTINVDAADDAIHSNDAIIIDGGNLTLASGDDGIHGDYAVTINGGSITITQSFEGIETEVIEINDGFIDVTSDDDGLNVAGAEATATSGRDAGGGTGDYYIYINGGVVVITVTGDLAEQGDGIDSNGYIEMSGGLVVVNGPTDTRNSALDYNGNFVMSGGLFIGTNIDGRHSSGTGAGSTQASLYLTADSTISAGTVIHIETSDGESLVTFEPLNEYNVIVFSSSDLVDGEDYSVYLGGSVSGESDTGLYDDSAYSVGDLAGTVTASL